jgi:hypothetical protein
MEIGSCSGTARERGWIGTYNRRTVRSQRPFQEDELTERMVLTYATLLLFWAPFVEGGSIGAAKFWPWDMVAAVSWVG